MKHKPIPMTPYELAKKAFETDDPSVAYTDEELDNMATIKKCIAEESDGSPSCWFAIKRNGWITIDDNCGSDHAICTPDELKGLCEWYLGLNTQKPKV